MSLRDLKIMIVAGEASGDRHAAKLVEALRERNSTIDFFGSAGPMMRAAGVRATIAADELSIVGLAEIVTSLPMFIRALTTLRREAEAERPDVAILVDFPDFNLKLAKHLKRLGIRVVYYISPQLWAWRQYRISAIRNYVDLLLTILPFEKDWYAARGVEHVEYVGNPLAKEVHCSRSREEFRRAKGIDEEAPLVALLPGSRTKEIVRILPVMVEAAKQVRREVPDARFVIPLADERHRAKVEESLSQLDALVAIGETYDAVAAADAAAVTSGTATLETGILGTPMAIVYKTSAVNYALLEPLIDVPHYGLINLIAGERLATELIQGDFTAERLSGEVRRLLEPQVNLETRARLAAAAAKLGEGGASARAADATLLLLGRSS